MKRRSRLGAPRGFDELMIVNPTGPREQFVVLGADGALYDVETVTHPPRRAKRQLLLGEDGTLYEVIDDQT